jgi:arsR-family transcription regulator
MKEKTDITLKVTSEEEELIKAIRNYCKSYPNGYPDLLIYAQDVFDRITSMPK